MASGIPNSALLDLIQTTQQNYPPDPNDFEAELDLQSTPFVDKTYRSESMQVDGGERISRRTVLDHSGHAKFVQLYERRAISVSDVAKTIEAPWCQMDSYYSIDRREVLRNRSKASKIIDLVKVKRRDALIAAAEQLELVPWTNPTTPSDSLFPLGIFYWGNPVTPGTTNSDGGFVGQTVVWGNNSTSTTVGGLDKSSTDNAKFRNWAQTYTKIDNSLVKAMRKTYRRMRFRAPYMVEGMGAQPSEMLKNSFRIYSSFDVVDELEDILNKSNNELRYDFDTYGGAPLFHGIPIIPLAALNRENNTQMGLYDPLVFLNHKKWYPVIQEGEWMRENEPQNDVEQHNSFTTWFDWSFQLFCCSPRQGIGIIHKPLPSSGMFS